MFIAALCGSHRQLHILPGANARIAWASLGVSHPTPSAEPHSDEVVKSGYSKSHQNFTKIIKISHSHDVGWTLDPPCAHGPVDPWTNLHVVVQSFGKLWSWSLGEVSRPSSWKHLKASESPRRSWDKLRIHENPTTLGSNSAASSCKWSAWKAQICRNISSLLLWALLWSTNTRTQRTALHVDVLHSKAPAFHLLIEAKREHLRLHSRFANFASPVFIAESTMLWGAARQARKARTLLLPLKVVSPCWVSLPNPGSIGLHALHILTSKRMWRNARQKDLEEKKVRVLHFMSIRNVLAVLCRI